MLKKLAILFLAVITATLLYAGDRVKTIMSKSKKSVVFISIYGGSGKERAQATGFFLGGQGYIVTNFHVVYDAANLSVKTSDEKKYWIKDMVAADVESDIAVFTVSGINSREDYLSFTGVKPEEGDEVIVIGNPLGLEFSVSNGIIAASRKIPEIGQVYQITAPISPGSSGSPVLNSDGEVIGVAAMQFKEGQNLNFVVPYNIVEKILASKQIIPFKSWKKSGIGYMPPGANGKVKLGFMYYGSEKFQEAAECAYAALKIEPKNAEAYYLAGISVFELKQYEYGINYMKKAIELDPKMDSIHNDLGNMYHKLNNEGQATEEFFNEIKANPGNQNPYCNLAEIYLAGGTPDNAVDILKRGLVSCDNTARLHAVLGLVYSETDEMTSAMMEEKTAIKLDETCAEAYYGLGVVCVKSSDKDGALKAYEKLKTLDEGLAKDLVSMIYK
jgi:tetratricopeptide (TPR) repeat protein